MILEAVLRRGGGWAVMRMAFERMLAASSCVARSIQLRGYHDRITARGRSSGGRNSVTRPDGRSPCGAGRARRQVYRRGFRGPAQRDAVRRTDGDAPPGDLNGGCGCGPAADAFGARDENHIDDLLTLSKAGGVLARCPQPGSPTPGKPHEVPCACNSPVVSGARAPAPRVEAARHPSGT